jgi:hypothetical protein
MILYCSTFKRSGCCGHDYYLFIMIYEPLPFLVVSKTRGLFIMTGASLQRIIRVNATFPHSAQTQTAPSPTNTSIMKFLLPALRLPSSSQAGKLQTLGSLALVAASVALGMEADRKRESLLSYPGGGCATFNSDRVRCVRREGRAQSCCWLRVSTGWFLERGAVVCDQRGFAVLFGTVHVGGKKQGRNMEQWIGSERDQGASEWSEEGRKQFAE